MTPKVVTVSPDQTVEDCMQMMTKEHIRHLPVVGTVTTYYPSQNYEKRVDGETETVYKYYFAGSVRIAMRVDGNLTWLPFGSNRYRNRIGQWDSIRQIVKIEGCLL